jgi:hypothetical protein
MPSAPKPVAPPSQLQLYSECCLPGCRHPVPDAGHPCGCCLADFTGPHGWRITATGEGALETAEQVADRKAGQAAAQARALTPVRRPGDGHRKANQTCWLCEQRRTCASTPTGWECDACQQV